VDSDRFLAFCEAYERRGSGGLNNDD
jgi:hypothetical protein